MTIEIFTTLFTHSISYIDKRFLVKRDCMVNIGSDVQRVSDEQSIH